LQDPKDAMLREFQDEIKRLKMLIEVRAVWCSVWSLEYNILLDVVAVRHLAGINTVRPLLCVPPSALRHVLLSTSACILAPFWISTLRHVLRITSACILVPFWISI
jgi:hypothetical protein